MPDVTIYHNPACGTCVRTLSLIRSRGIEPTIVEYMTQPVARSEWRALFAAAGLTPRELLREKDPLYLERGLDDEVWSDDRLLDLMAEHPSLINRPIVATPEATRLCRPPEQVLDILP